MSSGRVELVRELKSLRKGRGLLAGGIEQRIGPALRAACRVAETDGPVTTRDKVTARLRELADLLSEDLRDATLAAFAVAPDARLPLYQDRVHWAALRADRDPRTVRRRVDEAIAQIADLATGAAGGRTADRTHGWHTTRLRVVAALDRAQPEALEQRRIVVDEDGLREVDLTPLLPASRRDLDVCVFYGGALVERDGRFALVLPRPLARGETHEFEVRFRLPAVQAVRPHLVCVPSLPCELFDLRVRFGGRAPRVWTLSGAAPTAVSGPAPYGNRHPVDPTGELHLRFYQLTPGLAYGARWA